MKIKPLLLCIIFFLLANVRAHTQTGYKQGEQITDFKVQQAINYGAKAPFGLSNLQKDITILDFFGTWCMPCIKALPNLLAISQQNPDRVAVVLVSTEDAAQLKSFVNARKLFALPIVVDVDSSISNLFMPPSYPYTVVIGKDGKIIAFTEAASITSEKIAGWLNSQQAISVSKKTVAEPVMNNQDTATTTKAISMVSVTMNKTIQLSQDFIYSAKTGSAMELLISQLSSISYEDLKKDLEQDDDKLAFWINIYNGFTQASLKNNPEQYKSRGSFYGKKQIAVAGKNFSLDDIEHGILRRSKIKWSLGYFNKLFPSSTEKELRVSQVDYRIHFALNCGAKSCPPIAFYKPATLNQQLDIAAKSYLVSEVIYTPEQNTVMLPAIMSWFRVDFGGKKNMIKILSQNKIIPEGVNPTIHFKKYDWSLYLDNYKN